MKNKYPFSKQDGLKNCACACMQMIIKYYKGYISMDELALELNTNKSGTNAFQIVKVFEKIGFKASGIRLELNQLNKDITLPCIAHVVIDKSYEHYIVIYKINFKTKRILIADPSKNIHYISFNDFNKIWDNILIIMYPIKPIINNNEVYLSKIIYNLISSHKKTIIQLFLMSIVLLILSVTSSFFLKIFFDSLSSSKEYIFLLFIVFLLIYILRNLTNYMRTSLLIFINKKIDINMNMDIYSKVINLPYQYYRNRTTGEITSKISDLYKIRELINNLILTLFMDLPLTFISGLILYFINNKLFIICIIVLLLYTLIFSISKKVLAEKTDRCYEEKARMSSNMYEGISSFDTVKGLGIEKKIIKQFEIRYSKYLNEIINLDSFINTQNLFKELLGSISELVIIFYGIYLVKDGALSIGTLLAFNSMSNFFFTPMRNIINLDLSIEEANKAIKKAYEIIVKENNNLSFPLDGDIVIKNLDYMYDFDNKVLNNINLLIKKGEKVIITGRSGSGKSTLLKILMKYYEVKRNRVLIGEHDINDSSSIKESISYISQNEILYTDSLYNNMNISNDNNGDIIKISKICYVDEIIKNNNLGYNMLIEENGFNISGGQKQRIILSRALLSNFNILLIDEGLNQVDVDLERKILKNIFNMFKDKTIIFISHRLENLDLYDHLVELEDGCIKKDVIKC